MSKMRHKTGFGQMGHNYQQCYNITIGVE